MQEKTCLPQVLQQQQENKDKHTPYLFSAHAHTAHTTDMHLTPELIDISPQFRNPIGDRELDVRGEVDKQNEQETASH